MKTNISTLVVCLSALLGHTACSDTSSDDDTRKQAARRELEQLRASGQQPSSDVCDQESWYGDGECDSWCPQDDAADCPDECAPLLEGITDDCRVNADGSPYTEVCSVQGRDDIAERQYGCGKGAAYYPHHLCETLGATDAQALAEAWKCEPVSTDIGYCDMVREWMTGDDCQVNADGSPYTERCLVEGRDDIELKEYGCGKGSFHYPRYLCETLGDDAAAAVSEAWQCDVVDGE